MKPVRTWGTGIAFALASASAIAAPAPRSTADGPEGAWLAWGGQASFGFNPDALVALDLRVASASMASARAAGVPGRRYDTTTFPALDAGTLEVIHRGPAIVAIGGGELRFAGGFVLAHPGGSIDLRGFALRADPAARLGIAVVDASGRAWFTADHAHYGFDEQGPGTFSMYNMNLRLARAFAEALGRPDLVGHPVGTLEFRAQAQIGREMAQPLPDGGVCSAPFPEAGLVTDIALIYDDAAGGWTGHDDSVYVRRCGLPPLPGGGACTSSSTNGKVVIDQDSSLRNVGDTGVAWYQKFTSPSPPYGNDQHPYLIWNLYRIDADGRIKQIGVSAVKHAFLTINWAHVPGECGCAEGHVIYPTCEDTYSLSNNDNSSSGGSQQQNLAPRSEVVPSTAVWGRCGSVWDANCDGHMDSGSGAQNLYDYRMLVDESDMLAPLATGARYFFEYWYIVRDDENIYNTMGYREIQPNKSGANWQVSLVGAGQPDHDFFLGPVVDRWVDPQAPGANAMNRELSTPLGRARIAMKATDLGGGQWRYEYAVMNFDYAHVLIDPAHATEPNVKLLENHGFARFRVPLPANASVSAPRFDDADNDSGNDWSLSGAGGALTWSAPAGNTLDWGRLYHFEFVSDAPPAAATLGLTGAATATEAEIGYALDLLGPATVDDTIFRNGFD